MHSPILPQPAQTYHARDHRTLSWRCEALTLENFCALAPEWEDLTQAASEQNIFQFPEFIRNSIPLLADQNPNILTIRQSGLLIGIAILRRDNGYAKLPVPFWKSALHPEQYLGTPLARAGFEEGFANGLTAWLDQAPMLCCFVQLAKISNSGPLAEALIAECQKTGRAVLIANSQERAAIAPNTHSYSKPIDLLSASRRRNIRRARKRLSDAGDVSLDRLSRSGDLETWIDQFLAMEDSGWKREQGSSVLSCPHETALYRSTLREAFRGGNLKLARLCLNGKPIAYTLDVLAPPIGFCLKSAIDPKYRHFSPGVLMEYETLKYYLERGDLDLIDSCSLPDNAMLNELWPDRRQIADVAIARKGMVYGAIFAAIRALKTDTGRDANG